MALLLIFFTGVFVGASTDTRCHQGNNETWPKNECNSFIIDAFKCYDRNCYYDVTIPKIDLDKGFLYRIKFDAECDCICHCKCRQVKTGDELRSKIGTMPLRDEISNQMDPGCYQFQVDNTTTPSISSCCVRFPAYDSYQPYDRNQDVTKEKVLNIANESDQTDMKWWVGSLAFVVIVVLILVAMALRCICKQHPNVQPTIELGPSRDSLPGKGIGKNKTFLLIYPYQSHNQLAEILLQLTTHIENGIEYCKVWDYKKSADLLERGIFGFLREMENRYEKVIVLLSPEVSTSSDPENAATDIFSKFSYYFFTEYLPHHHSDDQLIFVSHERSPCLDLRFCHGGILSSSMPPWFCSVSKVYALPARLSDLLEHLQL